MRVNIGIGKLIFVVSVGLMSIIIVPYIWTSQESRAVLQTEYSCVLPLARDIIDSAKFVTWFAVGD
jgi:hypothetical protein